MITDLRALSDRLSRKDIREHEPLARYTTFKIGGASDLFLEVRSSFDLVNTIAACNDLGLAYVVLGGGSNLLISDKGFRGVVIRNRGGDVQEIGDGLIEAAGGVLNKNLLQFTVEKGLTGFEFLIGIPGTIGAAVRNNGHFRDPKSFSEYHIDFHKVKDQFVNDFVRSVLLVTPQGQIKRVGHDYLQPEYHRSRLKATRDIVISATFQLGHSEPSTVKQAMQEQLQWRKERKVGEEMQMPPDPVTGHIPRQPSLPSPGCTFSNTANPENHPVGRMIDLCGLKGWRVGNVMVANEHANWIVNLGGGTATDTLALIDVCKEAVFKRFGVELTIEIDMIGEW